MSMFSFLRVALQNRDNRFALNYTIFMLLVIFACVVYVVVSTSPAHADELVQYELSWEQPMTYEDGAPMADEDITGYKLYVTPEGMDTQIVEIGNVRGYTYETSLPARREPYRFSFAIAVEAANGLTSAPSNTVDHERIVQSSAKPSAPVRLRFGPAS